jgi:hypothetical protein
MGGNMLNKKIIMYLSENNLLTKNVVTEEQYHNFQALNVSVDYVIKKVKNYNSTNSKDKNEYYYMKYSWEDLSETQIRLLIESQKSNSLKNIEKYLRFFYILAIVSLCISFILVFLMLLG